MVPEMSGLFGDGGFDLGKLGLALSALGPNGTNNIASILNTQNAMQMAPLIQAQRASLLGQGSAKATLLGGYDPSTGITWNGPRQSVQTMDPNSFAVGGQTDAYLPVRNMANAQVASDLRTDSQNMMNTAAQAFPDQAQAAAVAKFFPTQLAPDKRFLNVGGRVIDLQPAQGAGPKVIIDQAPNLPAGANANGDPLPGMGNYWKTEAASKRNPLEDDKLRSEIEKNKAQAALGESNLLSGDTLDMSADQLLAGDPSPMQGLGYGNIGAANRAALRNAVTAKAQARGMSGADIAAVNAQYFGTKAGMRTIGNRAAQMDMSANEANNMAGQALETSRAVNRAGFVPWNKAMQMYQAGNSDPSLGRFIVANTSLINAYAMAVGKGTPTVSGQEHARDMLSTATSQEDYEARVDQLKKEMESALASPGQAREALTKSITGQGAAAAPSPGVVKWTRDANGNPVRAQ